ncbi:MAG TPA: hypothetical protein VGO62_16255 [Myxococcota bacterium]
MLALALAVLPLTGVSVTAADVVALAPLDDAIRAAAARSGIAVQSKEQTLAALASARAAGVECAVADVACFQKIGVLAEVELVLVPVATPRVDGTALVLTLIDVSGARAPVRISDVVTADKPGPLVDALFARAAEVPIVDVAPAPVVVVDARPPVAPAPAASEWPWVGAIAAAAVVGVVVGGAVAWVALTQKATRP